MDQEWLEEMERQLSATNSPGAPPELRRAVLADVARELRSARWDRRLARAAVVLLVVGVGLNAALVWQDSNSLAPRRQQLVLKPASDSLVETAIVVAEATNTETAQNLARRLAALRGRALTDQEFATISAAATRDRG